MCFYCIRRILIYPLHWLKERREREQQEFESAKEMADEDYDCV